MQANLSLFCPRHYTEICVDLLDDRRRATYKPAVGPRSLRGGPATLRPIRAVSAYLNDSLIAIGKEASQYPTEARRAAPCDDFMSRINSHVDLKAQKEEKELDRCPMWRHQAAKIGRTVEQVITEYVEKLYTTIKEKELDNHWPDKKYNWHFVFSVPASFTKIDRKRFVDILRSWNNGRNFPWTIVRQPVAAAIYAIRDLSKAKGMKFQLSKLEELRKDPENTAFILLDAGWRKTEILSYHLLTAESHGQGKRPPIQAEPYLRVKRTPIDNIYLDFGSDDIDEEFLTHLHKKVKDFWRESLKGSEEERKIQESFMKWKKDAQFPQNGGVELNGLGSKFIKNPGGSLKIDEDTFTSFFQPCVDATVKAILKHMENAKPKNIRIISAIFVGGLGSNSIFQREIKNQLSKNEVDILVSTPQHAEFAVALGSILEFQQRPRASYGIRNKDDSYLWFLDKGQRCIENSGINDFGSHLTKRADSFEFEIVRHVGNLETRPACVAESSGRPDFESQIYHVSKGNIPSRNPARRRKLQKWKRLFEPSFQKYFMFSFEASHLGLRFQIKGERGEVIRTETWHG